MIIQKIKQFFQTTPNWVSNGVTLVAGIVTIVTGITTIVIGIMSYLKVISAEPYESYEINVNYVLLGMVLILLLLSIVICLKWIKYGKLLYSTRKVLSENYYHFLRNFRNRYFTMLKEHKSAKNTPQEYKIGMLTSITKEYLKSALDYLCEIISSSALAEMNACIKVIENVGGNGQEIDLSVAKVKTFCRSTKVDSERMSRNRNRAVSILDNTDFKKIITEGLSVFYQRDLCEYAKKLEEAQEKYENTTPMYWEYYRGVIVVPIRVAREHLYYTKSNDGYDVIGFLCVDTKSTEAFRDKDKWFYANIVKSFAAELYIVLNKYNYYLRKEVG